jgi:hypothetical protein
MLNIGIWGPTSPNVDTFVEENHGLETRLGKLSGRKILYSHTYWPGKEFWGLYDRNRYERLIERYSALSLPTVWDKVKVDEMRLTRRRS